MEKTVDFGEALKALKAGKKVARAGWNGKGPLPFWISESVEDIILAIMLTLLICEA